MVNKKKQFIEEKSTHLFKYHGLKSTSMDDIAKETGMSKKSIYLFFPSKADLIKSIIKKTEYRIKNKVSTINHKSENNINACFQTYRYIFVEESVNSTPAIYWDFKKYYPNIYESFYTFLWYLLAETTVIQLEGGIKKGIFIQDVNPLNFCYLLINTLLGILNQTQIIKAKFNTNKLIEYIIYYSLRSIATSSGLAVLVAVAQLNECLHPFENSKKITIFC